MKGESDLGPELKPLEFFECDMTRAIGPGSVRHEILRLRQALDHTSEWLNRCRKELKR